MIYRRSYVICHDKHAGITLYRYHNGWLVIMLAGGFQAVLDENMRRATANEIVQIERDWIAADASRDRVDTLALDKLAQRVFGER